jgi:hypothetical protein
MKTQQKRLDSPLKANLISISLEEEREKEASQTTYLSFDQDNTDFGGERETTGQRSPIG